MNCGYSLGKTDRGFSLATVTAALLCIVECGSPPSETPRSAGRRPNILWILLDTARASSLSSYGYGRRTTPNIDALASRGVLFEQNFAQATWTVRSVPSFMTGRYFPAQSFGVFGFTPGLRYIRLPANGEKLFSEIAREGGYDTIMVTKESTWFTDRSRLTKSFDRFVGVKPGRLPKTSLGELNERVFPYLSKDAKEPFFLYVHAWDVHGPHHLEEPYDRWLDNSHPARNHEFSVGANLSAKAWFRSVSTLNHGRFSDRDQEYLRGSYDGSLYYADQQIGLLLKHLEELDLIDNTLIVISSDHGEALAEDGRTTGHGGFITVDEVTHVPLIFSGPGVPRGRRVSQITENVDIVPTLTELLRLPARAKTDGRSLVPLIFGAESTAVPRYALTILDVWDGTVSSTDDLEISGFSLRGNSFRYERISGKECLYRTPDLLAERVNIKDQFPDITATMRAHLSRSITPLMETSAQAELMAAFFDVDRMNLPGGDSRSENAIVSAEGSDGPARNEDQDNRWKLRFGRLISSAFSEDAPSLIFDAPVRNGRYRVLAEILCKKNHEGHPASSVAFTLGGDSETRTVTCDAEQLASRRFFFVEIGTYETENRRFSVTVDEGDRSYWAILKSFVLLPQNAAAESEFYRLFGWNSATEEEVDDTLRQLKALGYVN